MTNATVSGSSRSSRNSISRNASSRFVLATGTPSKVKVGTFFRTGSPYPVTDRHWSYAVWGELDVDDHTWKESGSPYGRNHHEHEKDTWRERDP
ncbi:hypothetical protein GCM10012275_22210 [Longimycelium tulufanense]|uniref:Uncharacterized protein n=1 Tax=Longimycelium tulufanense TaxID=907463 RepID=A0A8J3CBX4_9PSEU|nr:hypothetical protein GCM10012275_22210 [Longimycelium tulufanense]